MVYDLSTHDHDDNGVFPSWFYTYDDRLLLQFQSCISACNTCCEDVHVQFGIND